MSSFLAKLEIDGNTYNVLEYDLHFNQERGPNGRPVAAAQGGDIRVVIESDKNTEFVYWGTSHNQTKDGKITFYKHDAMSRLKEVVFKKAYCIGFHESFRADGRNPMKIELTLSAGDIIYGIARINKNWPFAG